MKEKFPVINSTERYFGIDAGRIMMLLRLCTPNDSNAMYVVRQVNQNGRKFEGWKYITLSKMLMNAGWNLQSGGVGMGGQNTHTIKIPYDEFQDLSLNVFEEESLQKMSNLPQEVKEIALQYIQNLETKFF